MSEKMLTQKIIDISNKKFEYTSPDQISLSMIRYYCLSINEENSIYPHSVFILAQHI